MSHQLTVLLKNELLPGPEEINAELLRLGLPFQIASDASLKEEVGSFAARIKASTPVTCQIQFENSSWLAELPKLRKRAGDRDRCIDFLLGTDMDECAMVTAIGAALSSLCSAVVYYPPDDLYYTTEESVAEVHSTLKNKKLHEHRFLKPDKCAGRKPVEVDTFMPGWIKCPGCQRKFALKDTHVWDGQRHLSCGQKIVPTGQLEETPPKNK